MNKTLLGAAIALSLTAGSAFADQPSFNYLEGGYSQFDFDDDTEADGFSLRGSVEITDNVYVAGKGTRVSSDDEFGADVDRTLIYAGAGLKFPIQESASLYTQLSYVYADIDIDSSFGDFSDSESGYELEGGLRAMVAANTELSTNIKHTDLDGATTTVGVGLRQYFNDSFGVYAEISRNDFDTNFYDLGASFRF